MYMYLYHKLYSRLRQINLTLALGAGHTTTDRNLQKPGSMSKIIDF